MAKKINVTLADRVVGWFSPKRGLERARYRMAFNSLRNWDAGSTDRPNGNWLPLNQTPEETDASYRDRIRARGRDLERNNEIAASAIKTVIRNVVGTGIKPQAQVRRRDGTMDTVLNNELEALWKKWIKPGVCDIEGHSSFYDLQAMLLRRRIVDGEILAMLPLVRDGNFLPLKVQLWEPDYLTDLAYPASKGSQIYSGVEVNEFGKPQAYHFTVDLAGKTKRIPAWQVMHLFQKTRPRQVRGMSEFAATMTAIKDLGEYMEAELVAARIAACYAVFVESDYNGAHLGRRERDSNDRPIESVEPGMFKYLLPGERISSATPGRPNTDAAQFSTAQTRRIAAGLGLSFETLSRDYSQGSYSSARQGHLEDRKEFQALQQYEVDHFCQPVWEEFVWQVVYRGLVKVSDFDSDRDRYTAAAWIAPGWQWIDPLKEVKSVQIELEEGITSLSKVCAQKGEDWQEVMDQRKREQDYATSIGLELGGVDRPAEPQEAGGDEKE